MCLIIKVVVSGLAQINETVLNVLAGSAVVQTKGVVLSSGDNGIPTIVKAQTRNVPRAVVSVSRPEASWCIWRSLVNSTLEDLGRFVPCLPNSIR